MTVLPPPPRVGPAIATLRHDLDAAGYRVDSVAERLGPVAQRALAREEAVPALRSVSQADDPLAVLLRLFVLGGSATRRQLDAALPKTGAAGCESLGLVHAAGSGTDDEVRATVDLEPQAIGDESATTDGPADGEWWVVSDHGELALRGQVLPADHVLGVGTASMTLIEAVLAPHPGARVADVGCGSGIQALHLSRFTGDVLATDASARAADFARTTLALNDVPARVAVGDLLAPLDEEGGGFDHIVSNLPFVITPRDRAVPAYTYRDAGYVGDAVSARMVREAPSRLRRDGIAQFLANWEVPAGAAWDDRIRGWVATAADDAARTGDVVDVWVVQRELADPGLYAEAWISDGGRPDQAVAARWYESWLSDFETRQVEAIGFGIVTMRRRSSGVAPLRRYDDRPEALPGPLRVALSAGLAGHDALGALGALGDASGLLGARLTIADGVVERRDYQPGAADPRTVHLVDTARFGRMMKASAALGGVVGACDGELNVATIIGAVADLLGLAESDVREQVLPSLRRMVAEGMLVVTSGP